MHRELSAEDSIEEIVRKVFSTSIQAIEETRAILDLQALEAAARTLRSCRQHDFYGVGGSAQVARDISHKFLRIGVRTSVFDDPHLMLMSASLLGPADALIAFSHSGTTASVIEAAKLGRSRGATLIVVTNYDGSPLAQTADIVLCSTARGSPLTGENAAARIAQLNILDALFAAVAQGDYAAAEDNLNQTMSSVSANRRGRPTWLVCGRCRQSSLRSHDRRSASAAAWRDCGGPLVAPEVRRERSKSGSGGLHGRREHPHDRLCRH